MKTPIRIDFISDVACPWCVVGLRSLEAALAKLGDAVTVEIHFQPFELNPAMLSAGQDLGEHLMQKYGMSPAQLGRNQAAIRERGAALGFRFDLERRNRVYNMFDAHRLIHWAGLESPAAQRAMKHALFAAYFTEGGDMGDVETLVGAARVAGLDADRARTILASDQYADDVRKAERYWIEQGIAAVPSVVFDDRHLLQGGQPVEVFERALRQIAAARAA